MRNALGVQACLGAILVAVASDMPADESIRVVAEMAVEEAWMGEGVKFDVVLFSPGPFSGTARFQIPELEETIVVKDGSPVVGSAEDGGRSWITQRHAFRIYTQQVGEVSIPAFAVSFDSKDSFLGDAVARQGTTQESGFRSLRPPGTKSMSHVVSSATLVVEEGWSQDDGAVLEAGDVVTRSITRTATDTSAMFLEPFESEQVDGIRVYLDQPQIEEKSARGQKSIKRVDRIKYQFTRGGTFDIAAIEYAWWDPKAGKVRSVSLEGRGFQVTAPPVPPEPTDWKQVIEYSLLSVVSLVALFFGGRPWVRRGCRAWHAAYHAPVAMAARQLRKSCRAGDASSAYAALVAWKAAAGITESMGGMLDEQSDLLAHRLYGSSRDLADGPWDGSDLLQAFKQFESDYRSRHRRIRHEVVLPPLNPDWVETARRTRS